MTESSPTRTRQGCFRFLPMSPRKAHCPSYVKAIHPEDRDEISRVIGETIAGGATFDQEYRVIRTDGSARWVEARGKIERTMRTADL